MPVDGRVHHVLGRGESESLGSPPPSSAYRGGGGRWPTCFRRVLHHHRPRNAVGGMVVRVRAPTGARPGRGRPTSTRAADCLRGRPAESRLAFCDCDVIAVRMDCSVGCVADRLGPSLSALRDAEERLTAVVRRRAGQHRRLKQNSDDTLDVFGALIPRVLGTELPPQPPVVILVAGRAGPTWDRYVPPAAFRDWQEFASTLGFVVMPAKPAGASSRSGRSQTPDTRRRRCASVSSTPLASWRGSPPRRRTLRSGRSVAASAG